MLAILLFRQVDNVSESKWSQLHPAIAHLDNLLLDLALKTHRMELSIKHHVLYLRMKLSRLCPSELNSKHLKDLVKSRARKFEESLTKWTVVSWSNKTFYTLSRSKKDLLVSWRFLVTVTFTGEIVGINFSFLVFSSYINTNCFYPYF
jgi:hypothetical protein